MIDDIDASHRPAANVPFRDLKQDPTRRGIAARHDTHIRPVCLEAIKPQLDQKAIAEWMARHTSAAQHSVAHHVHAHPVKAQIDRDAKAAQTRAVRAQASASSVLRNILASAHAPMTSHALALALHARDPRFGHITSGQVSGYLADARRKGLIEHRAQEGWAWCGGAG